jgi:phospholipid/cholesterol/gamma-HCH transport system substrate-binding protein
VTDIRLDIDRVLVDIAINLDEPLRQGSEFWVKNTSPMGSTRVILVPGQDKKFLRTDHILEGKTAMGFTGMMNEAGDIMLELKTMLNDFNSSENIVDKYSLIADTLQLAINNVNRMLERNDGNFNEIVVNLDKITNKMRILLENNEENIDNTISGAGQLVTDLSATSTSIKELSQQTRVLVEKMQKEESTFSKLTGDDELYRSLLRSVSSLDSLLADIKKNPKKYFKVEVF